ncbi:hypothetical protein ACFFS2_39750 [Streptomyces aurantiacus]|uniref:hypothetical protein n=1 Tax=Streptomyces aurantiacus TaxID=47760 RepID=UPI0012FE8828|nr:hypothetical protein [Streptomyces aurantiacus]
MDVTAPNMLEGKGRQGAGGSFRLHPTLSANSNILFSHTSRKDFDVPGKRKKHAPAAATERPSEIKNAPSDPKPRDKEIKNVEILTPMKSNQSTRPRTTTPTAANIFTPITLNNKKHRSAS